jgi:hypothetical protein
MALAVPIQRKKLSGFSRLLKNSGEVPQLVRAMEQRSW